MSEVLEADFVIVGAGSAGCALAYRLSQDGRHSVLVLEKGGSDFGPLIQMPAAFSIPMNMARYDWGYRTEPEPHLNGRRLAVPRGKVVGGSSSINGMVYVRGHARDFDTWEEMGAAGWGFRHVAPYFKRMETSHGGEAGWRGTDGPLNVTRGTSRNPLYTAFIEAGLQAGYGATEDYNGRVQEGFGAMEMTVWQGVRWSAANAYLKPALKRGNVRLVVGVEAERIAFEGLRAVGVEVRRGGKRQTVRALKEVIVAASSINSPKLLMLSGIGPAEALKAHGIDVRADRPGVGANLQDHLELYVQYASRQPITLNRHLNILSKAWIGALWLFLRRGLGTSNQFESCAFIRSAAGIEYPDIQYHFLPAAVRYDGRAAVDRHGFQVHVGPMRSLSRGHVLLASPDPSLPPSILFNYMSQPQDWSEFRTCIALTREIMAQQAMEPYVEGEIAPGGKARTVDQLDDFIRANVESAYHPCGTCRMGAADDPGAVVDPHCNVIGVEALRVVDSSIFPQITNGNLNAPSIMVGEKAADLILGRAPLPASNLEPWIHPEWQTRQR
jgi:choline dehydrogenase